VIDQSPMYDAAAADLDEHLQLCPRCATGLSCSAGDDAAEREFRSWRALQRTDPARAARRALPTN
jgi:hypothetical protein